MRVSLSAFLRTRLARAAALSAASLAALTCHSEPTAVCSATNLVLTAQPATVTAGNAISITAEAHDNSGTLQTCFTGSVSVAIGTNSGGATLNGTKTVTANAGVASFAGLTITKASGGYTLVVTATGLTAGTSTAFTILAGPATALTITAQPTNAQAGGTIGPAMVVTVNDQYSNTASGFAGNVTVAITTGTGSAGAALSGTTTVPATLGVATFSTLQINKTGTGYTLTASATGLVSVASNAFNINPGPVFQLAFTVQPSNVSAAGAITPSVVVTAQDNQGNTTPSFVGVVTVAIGTNPATGTLSGTKTLNATAGVATFSTLSIDKPGTGYTLSATGASITGTFVSTTFNVVVGTLSQLVFSQQPTNATAGVGIAPAITVTAQDGAGNTVTTFNNNVTLTIGTNPSGGTLSGTATVTAASGLATFTGVNIDKAGPGYVLTATAGAVSKQSSAFTISPAPPTQLVFTTQPVQTAAGAAIPTVVVTAEDQFNNVATAFANQVQVAITGGTGKVGAALSGTKTVTAAAGIAAFATLNIDSVGTNYTLTATATGLVGGFASASFNIVPNVATVLVFTAQPTTRTAGLAITPSVVVTARDTKGNTATGFIGNVSLAVTPGTGTAGAVVSGTPTVPAAAGIATFANLRLAKSGAGYTVTASATGLTPDTSAAFSITPGSATKVAFTAQPTAQTAGVAIAPAIQVTAQDSLGNTDTAFAGSVTLTITAATGTTGANLTGGGATAVAAHTGIATFAGVSIDSAGANYTLSATATGALTGAPSAPFNVRPGAATQLAFTVPPSIAVAGVAIAPAVKVTARDALGNTDTTFKTMITLGITAATGTTGANLSGGAVTAASGIATFGALSIDSVGTGYTLSASAAGPIVGGPSSAFNVTPGGAVKLAFLTQPTTATAGPPAQIPSFQVVAQDVLGNTAASFTGNITVAIGANPGGGSLAGTLIVGAVSGTATFDDLSINKSGTGYKLQATSGALSPAASAFFDVVAGTATKLAFTVEPVTTQAGGNIAPAVQVSGQDALGNTDFNYADDVTITLGTIPPPGTGVLSGTTLVTASTGVASFSLLQIDVVAAGYTLNASATGVTGTPSATFNIIPNVVDHVTISAVTSTTAGVAMSPAVLVTAFDASNNVATQFTGGVTLQITGGTGTAGAHLTGGASVTVLAASGVATFSNLRVDSAGTDYSLSVTSPKPVTSGLFDITPAPAAVLVFTTQPGNAVAGANNSLVVTARDSVGNRATGFGSLVTLGVNSGPGTILSGGTATAASGTATFSTLRNDLVGSYTLSASGGGVSTAVASASYNITPAAASVLVFTGQPSNTVAAVAISPAIAVTAKDPFGNIDTNFGSNITLAPAPNPGGSTIAGETVTATAGVATFPNVTLNKVANGYRLTASASGPISSAVPSNLFNITPAVATKLVFTTNPVTTTAGVTMANVVVAAEDPNGNIDTSFTGTITLAFANNPGGGGLGGTLIKVSPHGVGGGVVTFNDLSITVAATSYRLQVTSGSLTQGQSTAFDINAAAATQLIFTGLPVTPAIAGQPLRPGGAAVTAQDQFGNTDPSFTGIITLSRISGPVTQLFGDTTIAAQFGVATFTDVNIHLAGAGYTLRAAFTGLVSGNSNLFDVKAAPATHLVFTGQPGPSQTAGASITPAIQVTARDQFDNTDLDFNGGGSGIMTVAVNTGPGSVNAGPTAVISNGVASFPGVQINLVGTYTLKTSSGVIVTSPLASSSFTVTAAAANHLVFTQPPTGAVAGVAITPTITVTAKDQFGNTDLSFNPGGTMQVDILSGPPGGNFTGGNLSDPIVNGAGTFPTLAFDKVGSYTLQAVASGPIVTAPLASPPFSITPAGANHFTFTVNPTNAVAGASISPAIVVQARDVFENVATGFGTNTVDLTINTGAGAILSGASVSASGGVATFSAVSIDLAGAHTLAATSAACGACAAGISASFNITHAAATKLGFTQEPTTTLAGNTISPDILVAAQDQFGNTDPTFSGTVTISISVNPGGGVLSGTLGRPFAGGVATFDDLSINSLGTGYRLLAVSSPLLTQIVSALFNIN